MKFFSFFNSKDDDINKSAKKKWEEIYSKIYENKTLTPFGTLLLLNEIEDYLNLLPFDQINKFELLKINKDLINVSKSLLKGELCSNQKFDGKYLTEKMQGIIQKIKPKEE